MNLFMIRHDTVLRCRVYNVCVWYMFGWIFLSIIIRNIAYYIHPHMYIPYSSSYVHTIFIIICTYHIHPHTYISYSSSLLMLVSITVSYEWINKFVEHWKTWDTSLSSTIQQQFNYPSFQPFKRWITPSFPPFKKVKYPFISTIPKSGVFPFPSHTQTPEVMW